MKRRKFVLYFSLLIGSFIFPIFTIKKSNPFNFLSQNKKIPLEKLRFAVTDVQGLADLKRDYDPFKNELEKVLNIPVELFPVDNYTQAATALQANTLDLVLAGPSEYVVINTRTNSQPLLAINRPYYYSIIVVPTNSKIKTLTDLKGKTIAMLKIGSTSGHLGPTNMLINDGLNPQTDYQVKMLGREGSLEALKKGEVDAWAGPFIDYERFLRTEKISEKDFLILQKSPLLPSDVLMIGSHIKPEITNQIKTAIMNHQEELIKALATPVANEKFKVSTFITAKDSDYDLIRNVYKAMGEGVFFEAENK